jgi:hypothetical protein
VARRTRAAVVWCSGTYRMMHTWTDKHWAPYRIRELILKFKQATSIWRALSLYSTLKQTKKRLKSFIRSVSECILWTFIIFQDIICLSEHLHLCDLDLHARHAHVLPLHEEFGSMSFRGGRDELISYREQKRSSNMILPPCSLYSTLYCNLYVLLVQQLSTLHCKLYDIRAVGAFYPASSAALLCWTSLKITFIGSFCALKCLGGYSINMKLQLEAKRGTWRLHGMII